jgi:hypothetical protein
MKTKHLFTFFVLLSLTSSGMLLTEVSSIAKGASEAIAQGTEDVARTPDKKTTELKASEKNTLPPETPSINNISNSSTPSVTSAASNEVRGAKASSDDPSPLPLIFSSLSGLLHLLEIAGLVWAYLRIQQLTEKSRDSRSQIKSLTDRLSASEQKQQAQGEQLKKIGSEAANARNLTSRMNAIEQASQKKANDIGSTNPAYNLPSPGVVKSAAAPSIYPFLDTYRQSSDNFKNQYSPKIVSEDADNLQKRRAGDYQEIILGEDRQGNYWLFNDGSTTYLIPSPKLKINDLNIRTAGGLFTCENYTPGYQHVNVVRPAIVSSQIGTNERWKLEQKGILEFV